MRSRQRSSEPPAGSVLRDGPRGAELVITGTWPAGVDGFLREHDAGLVLNDALGFDGTDLAFLHGLSGLRSLTILDPRLTDLAPVESLTALEHLTVEAAAGASVDLACLPHLRSVWGPWAHVLESIGQLPDLAELRVTGYDQEHLDVLAPTARLEELAIKGARALIDFRGLERFSGLSDLLVAGAPRLEDISALESLSALVRFELEACNRVNSLNALRPHHDLRFAGFSDCGAIDSIDPLRDLRSLETVHAWGSTRFVDGDLSPLLALPRLRELRMMNRRHYRPKTAEIEAAIGWQP